jgi:uncharacterized protein (TIGR02118 family)
MVKLVFVLRARKDMAPEEVHRYWYEEHAPKVRSVAEAIRARRYVQSHTIDTPLNQAFIEGRGMSPIYDGITELWFDSLEDLQAAASSPEGGQALQMLGEDEAKFIDLSRSTIFMTEEHEIFDLTE